MSDRVPEPKKMGRCQDPPRCILCGVAIKEGESYHQLSHHGTKKFHVDCFYKLFEKREVKL